MITLPRFVPAFMLFSLIAVPIQLLASENSSQFIWKPSSESRQAYYVIPTTLANNDTKNVTWNKHKTQPTSQKALQQKSVPATEPKTTTRQYQTGKASYYGKGFHGRKTASGERFDQNKLTCAHGSLPFGCRLRVTNLRNNRSVEVKVNDRGAFHKYGRVIDLSKAAAKEIGMLRSGVANVKIEILELP